MPDSNGYTRISVHREERNRARKVKEELGLSWNSFLDQAADELDPHSNS